MEPLRAIEDDAGPIEGDPPEDDDMAYEGDIEDDKGSDYYDSPDSESSEGGNTDGPASDDEDAYDDPIYAARGYARL